MKINEYFPVSLTRLVFATLLPVFAMLCGCAAPVTTFVADTEIMDNLETVRFVSIRAIPDPRFPAMRAAVGDSLKLPAKESYSRYQTTDNFATFATRVTSPDKLPVDLMKKTEGTDLWAQNSIRLKRIDYGLLVIYEFEEKIDDIVERAEAEDTLERSVRLVVEVFAAALEKDLGESYDFTKFTEYLRVELPKLALGIYSGAWELQRAQLGSDPARPFAAEWDAMIRREVSRLGLYLEPYFSKKSKEENERLVWNFLDRKIAELVVPKINGTGALTSAYFRKKENHIRLLMQVVSCAGESFGTLPGFLEKLDIPIFAGAFSNSGLPFSFEGNSVRPAPPAPDLKFLFRAKIPGRIVKTNAVLDFDGRLIWRFDGNDVSLCGYRMWAKSMQANVAALEKLGISGFPKSLAVVEKFHECFLDADRRFDSNLAQLLKDCAVEGRLEPLRMAAEPDSPAGLTLPGNSHSGHNNVSPERAQRLLGLLAAYRKEPINAAKQDNSPQKPVKSGENEKSPENPGNNPQ